MSYQKLNQVPGKCVQENCPQVRGESLICPPATHMPPGDACTLSLAFIPQLREKVQSEEGEHS